MKKMRRRISSAVAILVLFLVYNYQDKITNFINDIQSKEEKTIKDKEKDEDSLER